VDGGNLFDTGQDDSNSGTDGSGGDGGMQVSCDGGLASCGGKCVDTSTDPMNCGGCGSICNTQCVKGICQLISMGCDAGPIGQVGDNACLGIDSNAVYWGAGFANGNVYKLPLGGGCPGAIVTGQPSPHAVVSDGTNVFFGNQGSGGATGTIQRVSVNGGALTPIATMQSNPLEIVLDTTNVYWANSGDGSVWKSDKTTPNPIKLAGPLGQGHANHLRVDATNVYFTDHTTGVVSKVPIAGGNVTNVTSTGLQGLGFIAIDSKNAYFGVGTSIQTAGLSGMGATPTNVVPNLPRVNGLETDGTNLWYVVASNTQQWSPMSGEIHRVTVGGQSDKILASMQNGPNCISVDSTSVYWINTGGGMISKTGK
jgi:hypothetical protein